MIVEIDLVVMLGMIVLTSGIICVIREFVLREKYRRKYFEEMLEQLTPRWYRSINKKPPQGRRVLAVCCYDKKHPNRYKVVVYKKGSWYETDGVEIENYIPKYWCYIPTLKFKRKINDL